ncbi:YggU family protein [Candidatus Woesearchaeota archaeon]|nr:YggU family protein [Candidatus Woesearchaeota archaeon]
MERITVIAKPNAPKTELLSYDAERNAYRIAVHAPPEKGKANHELIKFLGKLTKRNVILVSGKTAKEKVFKLIDKAR